MWNANDSEKLRTELTRRGRLTPEQIDHAVNAIEIWVYTARKYQDKTGEIPDNNKGDFINDVLEQALKPLADALKDACDAIDAQEKKEANNA